MHGQISLESALDSGTKATFSIPFNKSQFPSNSPLVDIGSLPERLQSEMSVSGCASDDRLSATPPQSPLDTPTLNKSSFLRHHKVRGTRTPPQALDSDAESDPKKVDRKDTHILVVEDK